MDIGDSMEVWKDIDGYSGLYQISDYGRVKSLHNNKEKILTLKTNNKGYKWITLCLKGEQKHFLVHRLVANAFLLNKSQNKIINHIDENPSNNQISNLEWCSYSENVKKSSKFNTYNQNNRTICKTRNSKHKDTSNKVKQILNGDIINVFDNSLQVERSLGFDKSFILSCCRNKRKSAYGYQWQFI